MIRLAGRRHLRHRVFHGPAERTLVEVWLTDIAGLVVNGYAEPRATGPAHGPSWRLNPVVAPVAGHALVPSATPPAGVTSAPVEVLVPRTPAAGRIARAA